MTVEGFKTVFFRLRDRLQAEGRIRPGLTFHGVRHTAATILADVGCDEPDIMAITGHKSTAALRKYIEQADRKARAEKAIRRLEGAPAGRGPVEALAPDLAAARAAAAAADAAARVS